MDMSAAGRQTAQVSREYLMVNLDDYIDDYIGDSDSDGGEGGDIAADFAALKDCLKALADAVASTNLAVINAAQGDPSAATQRVQASVAALKRFHDAYKVLDQVDEGEAEADDEA